MDTQTYPGKGLSPSQLIFALNEELKRLKHSSSYVAKDYRRGGQCTDLLRSFTLDEVSQLDRDAWTALASIHEWKNSFVPVNRVPLEVLSLIPTHLPSQKDHFRATFVCRRWRRTFLQHGALWSQLYLSKGEVYVKTLLERAKGSALDVIAGWMDPIGATALLPPHIKRIRSLNFLRNTWVDIRKFSEFDSGPLPLLHTLKINTTGVSTTSSLPLFSNAVNLRAFQLHLNSSRPLNLFIFPNIASFELSMESWGESRALHLLDFLEASPKLQTMRIRIHGLISFDGVPRKRVVILPNVESLSLVMSNSERGYQLAAHISCPSVKHTSLTHNRGTDDITQEMFPALDSWNAIICQYTRSPVEEVALEMKTPFPLDSVECSLTLRSPDATIISLHFVFPAQYEDEDEDEDEEVEGRLEALVEIYWEAFSQASRAIRDLALLTNIKRLRIDHANTSLVSYRYQTTCTMNEVGQLFKSVGPLEELVLHQCDMGVYLASFHDHRGLHDVKKPVEFPPIKELTISHPLRSSKFKVAMVRLAKSQHALGVPFERVTVRMDRLPAEIAEKLRPWVGVVHCYNEVEPT